MKRIGRLAIFGVVAAISLAAAPPNQAGGPAPQSKKETKKKSQRSARISSMRGCVDEQDGRYVLVEERTLKPVANLEAESFPPEGFAKYMGHLVTVRGVVASGGDRPVMKVNGVEKLADACAPSQDKTQ